MTTLNDGLGFEELGGPGDAGSKASQVWITGSVTSESIVAGAQITTAGSITDGDGYLESSNLGSPTTYGQRVQAGFATTSAGSEADIDLGISFSSQPYAMAFGESGTACSAKSPVVSGVQTISGCTIIGEASTVYSWIAVGPA